MDTAHFRDGASLYILGIHMIYRIFELYVFGGGGGTKGNIQLHMVCGFRWSFLGLYFPD
jgi:hypothetical protein